jgi:hypothetical protein
VVIVGYRPNQFGITSTSPSQTQLDGWAPSTAFEDAETGATISGVDD